MSASPREDNQRSCSEKSSSFSSGSSLTAGLEEFRPSPSESKKYCVVLPSLRHTRPESGNSSTIINSSLLERRRRRQQDAQDRVTPSICIDVYELPPWDWTIMVDNSTPVDVDDLWRQKQMVQCTQGITKALSSLRKALALWNLAS
mmetsp:Transcript_152043/g.276488  ORF Transcript_152043/g.276488 Transcript_152043/m.276488 type:complete len:146 (+) Transcript_152043:108-545(+)